jgi:toxin ParE1/3/4
LPAKSNSAGGSASLLSGRAPNGAPRLRTSRLIDSITDTFVLLARQSYLGRSREDDFGAGSRSLSVGEYVIVYRVEDEDVLILRVAHGGRDLDAIFGN